MKDHFPGITVIDEAESVKASLNLLETTSYDLIFLDIELKDGVGFDVLKEMTDFVYVIVISSHKDYAIEAFKHNVVDYLLRPINIREFKRAVKKTIDLYQKSEAYKKLPDTEAEETTETFQKPVINKRLADTSNILVNYKNDYIAVPKKDILYVHAQGKCSEIFVNDGKQYISYKNLKEFETVFGTSFVRVHHSYLINIGFISQFSREASSVKLTNGKEIPVSTRKKEELLRKFSLF